MLEKTEGIVLHTIKHSDSGIISIVFTKKYGRLSFMVKGLSNKKGNNRRAYFQPLQPLSIEFYYREKKDIHIIRESSPLFTYTSLHNDIKRNSIIMFLGEVLYKALRPSGPDEQLYNYILEMIRYLDKEKSLTPNFHIGFIIGLTRYLGISPSNNYAKDSGFFDMQDGTYTSSPPLHGYYMSSQFSSLLNLFLSSSLDECDKISLSGQVRSEFLNNMLLFYSLHIPEFKNISSLRIYSEIFRSTDK